MRHCGVEEGILMIEMVVLISKIGGITAASLIGLTLLAIALDKIRV